MGNEVLKIKNLSKDFPGVKALNDVSFSLMEGEVLALLGENGAGKSTLVKCLTGANVPTSGSLEVFGGNYESLAPVEARRLGISAVYQEFNIVAELPVVENIFMGNNPGNAMIVDYKQMLRQAEEIFASFGVDINPVEPAGTLSPAMLQIVEIAKATALNVKILILDEPSAPLTDKEIKILFKIIENLKKKKTSVIYISHRLEEVFQICDRAVILRDGEKVGECMIKDTNRQELIKIMIGRRMTDYFPKHSSKAADEVVLNVKNLYGNGVKDISFELHRGEILGIAGLVGAGRTELMTLLFCDAKKDKGIIEVNGKEFAGTRPWHAIGQGIAFLPEDRKRSGLLLDKSIGLNISLACIRKLCRFGIINAAKEKEYIRKYCDRLNVKTPDYQKEVQYLSGGNQQKVIVAKWLATDSDILIFDEPTRGIDVGTKYEIYQIIHALADEGRSIIVVSSEFEELIGIADRIIVIAEGEMAGNVKRDSFDKELLLDMASGNK